MRTSKLLSALVVACAAAWTIPAGALNIALTNDDGWSAPGIQALKAALRAAGHTVTLAAPLSDQSGGSMAWDQGVSLLVTKRGDGEYSVAIWNFPEISAKPATTAPIAISIAEENGSPADLLISGINTSANIGLAALQSGTVGAAIYAAMSPLNGPVPAVAVGTDAPACAPVPSCQIPHYQDVANFIVRFVAHLQTKPGFLAREKGLLPTGVALIVSYPGPTPTGSEVKGIKVAVQSDGVMANGMRVSGAYYCASSSTALTPCSDLVNVGDTQRVRMFLSPDSTPEIKDSDLGYFTDRYVTIVPIVPDLTAGNPLVFKSILPGLVP